MKKSVYSNITPLINMNDNEKKALLEDEQLFKDNCNCDKYIPPILSKKENIYVIGDLHGDLYITKKILKKCKLIDKNDNWIGGNSVIVQVGDVLDNCRITNSNDKECDNSYTSKKRYNNKLNIPEDIQLFDYMTELNNKAQKYNGMVINLFGNHEIMNVLGDYRYVSKSDLDKSDRNDLFTRGKNYAKEIACTRLPACIIGSYLFVHGGIINRKEQQIENRTDLIKLTTKLRKWLLNLIDLNPIDMHLLLTSEKSIFWNRTLGNLDANLSNEHPICNMNMQNLKAFNVNGIIIAHTPHNNINSTCDNSVWRVDNKISYAFNKSNDIIQILHIQDDNIINVIGIKR